jgi:hypothetical protein
MISMNHINAKEYYERDIKCIQRFFMKIIDCNTTIPFQDCIITQDAKWDKIIHATTTINHRLDSTLHASGCSTATTSGNDHLLELYYFPTNGLQPVASAIIHEEENDDDNNDDDYDENHDDYDSEDNNSSKEVDVHDDDDDDIYNNDVEHYKHDAVSNNRDFKDLCNDPKENDDVQQQQNDNDTDNLDNDNVFLRDNDTNDNDHDGNNKNIEGMDRITALLDQSDLNSITGDRSCRSHRTTGSCISMSQREQLIEIAKVRVQKQLIQEQKRKQRMSTTATTKKKRNMNKSYIKGKRVHADVF